MDRERFPHETAVIPGSPLSEEAIGGFDTPMRRYGTHGEAADRIAFPASDESRHVAGPLAIIEGGNTLQAYKGPIEPYE